jgi:hypothetical protein
MKYLAIFAGVFAAVFGITVIAQAVQVSVPAAPGANYVLVSTSTGAYITVATSTLGITAAAGGSAGQLQWNSGGALSGVATSTLTPSSPLTGSFIQIGSGGSLGLDTSGSWTGNAGSATKLQTARAINGVNFDGTAAITISAASSTALTDLNNWTGRQTFAAASTTNLSVSNALWLSSLGTPAGTILAVDPNGKVIATTTSSGGVASVTGTYPVQSTGGTNPTVSLAFGTTTSNSWSALNLFNGGLMATASSTFTGSTYFPSGIWNSSGNVGIGTTTPNNLLSVAGLIDFNNTDFNTKLGYQAGSNIVPGSVENTFVGYQAGLASSTASTNTAVYDTAVGYQAFNSNATGRYDTAVGRQSQYSNTTGDGNTSVGEYSLHDNTTGISNTTMGIESLHSNTTGNNNTSYGRESLASLLNGSDNVAVGLQSLFNATTSSFNTSVGYQSLWADTTGQNNTALGLFAGGGGSVLSDTQTTIDNTMTFLGYKATRASSVASTTALSNATAVGANATVGESNALVLGNGVSVGIGTSTPLASLHIYQGGSGQSPFANSALVLENSGRTVLQLLSPNANDEYIMFGSPSANNRGFIAYRNSAIAAPSDQMQFQTAGSFNFNGGKVGIGTTSPLALLSLAGTSGIVASTTATSTFYGGGINLVTAAGNTGCFAINGTCLPTSAGSGAWPFTPSTNFATAVQATTTPLWAQNGLQASSTNQFVNSNIWGNLRLMATSSALLATDANGNVIGTSTVPTSFLTGSLGTINGTLFTAGSSITLNAATSTLLTDSNTWSGQNLFQGNFSAGVASSTSQASSVTIDWNQSNTFQFLLTQNTTINFNATSSHPLNGGHYVIDLCQDGVGSRTVNFVNVGQLVWANGTTSVQATANTDTEIGMVYKGNLGRYIIVASSTPTDTHACIQ